MGTAKAKVLVEALTCVGFESITVTTSAKTLTPTSGSVRAICQVQDQPVRMRSDGTAPTDVTGILGNDGDQVVLEADELVNFKIIRDADSSPSGKFVCQYYS